MQSIDLNPDHRIRYISDPDVTKVLKEARKFIKDNEIENVSNIMIQSLWDDEIEMIRYDAWIIHGGY